MKCPSPFVVRLVLVGGIILTLGLCTWNYRATARLITTNHDLLVTQQEVTRLARENRQIAQASVAEEDLQKLRADIRDLPKLRNEIHPLRERAREFKILVSENERLRSLKKIQPGQAAPANLPMDFIPKSALRDVGSETPEAALQSAFWAMCHGDLDRLTELMVGGANDLNQDKGWEKRNIAEEMSHFNGFRIAHKKSVSPVEMELGLQTSDGGGVFPVFVKLIGAEWKLVRKF
ncbi:MAG: hypothetical protein ABIQ35_03825 [Verrucomicrobiota bacterium]